MHTASSSADLASDGYELGRDVSAGNPLDSHATDMFCDLSRTASARLYANFSKRGDNPRHALLSAPHCERGGDPCRS